MLLVAPPDGAGVGNLTGQLGFTAWGTNASLRLTSIDAATAVSSLTTTQSYGGKVPVPGTRHVRLTGQFKQNYIAGLGHQGSIFLEWGTVVDSYYFVTIEYGLAGSGVSRVDIGDNFTGDYGDFTPALSTWVDFAVDLNGDTITVTINGVVVHSKVVTAPITFADITYTGVGLSIDAGTGAVFSVRQLTWHTFV